MTPFTRQLDGTFIGFCTTVGEEYLKVERKIEECIAQKFNLPAKMSEEVKRADNLMLYAEKIALMSHMEWDTKWSATQEAADVRIVEWPSFYAEDMFLSRFVNLQQDYFAKMIAG